MHVHMYTFTVFTYFKHIHFHIVYCAFLYRTLDVTLDLKDPQYPENNLGSLELAVTLSPKEGELKDAVRKLYELLIRLLIHLSLFLYT